MVLGSEHGCLGPPEAPYQLGDPSGVYLHILQHQRTRPTLVRNELQFYTYRRGDPIMPITLVPTVHGRLSRANERVYVDGLITGAEVVLSVDGTEFNHFASDP